MYGMPYRDPAGTWKCMVYDPAKGLQKQMWDAGGPFTANP
jgi:rubredoxin